MSRFQPSLDNWMGIGVSSLARGLQRMHRLGVGRGKQIRFWACSAQDASRDIQVEVSPQQVPHLSVRSSRKKSLGQTQILGSAVEVEAKVQGELRLNIRS